jgi:phosphonate transport system substrate-binding protein
MAILMVLVCFAGCAEQVEETSTEANTVEATTEAKEASTEPLVVVWYPNESGEELSGAREALAEILSAATGREVENKTTTDYAIAIEAVVSGNADFGWMGGEGYVQAHNKNAAVLPGFTNSGKSGTLDDAVYYSWLAVKRGNEDAWKDADGNYSIDNLPGKTFSFVSNSSTSGFKVPSTSIAGYFSQNFSEWADLTKDDLIEGGDGMFFGKVLFGGSHQLSCVNLLTDQSEVSAFCDSCVANYVELAEGEVNRPGAVYQVIENAEEPFDKLAGQQFVLIKVTPVLNAPFVYNSETLTADEAKAIVDMFTSDDVANNEKIFVPEDSEEIGLFKKSSEDMCFVAVNDEWYNPIRELGN